MLHSPDMHAYVLQCAVGGYGATDRNPIPVAMAVPTAAVSKLAFVLLRVTSITRSNMKSGLRHRDLETKITG